MRSTLMRLAMAAALVSAAPFGASSASAATIGQAVAPSADSCGGDFSGAQLGVGGGPSYTVPAEGTLTSFATRAFDDDSSGSTIKLLVLRPDPVVLGNYVVVGVSDQAIALPASAPANELTTTITPIEVQAGDLLGIVVNQPGGGIAPCAEYTSDPADRAMSAVSDEPQPGESIAFVEAPLPVKISISANFEPTPVGAECDEALSARGCWAFDEVVGPAALDSSPFANHGSYIGNPQLGVPGVDETAVRIDGVDDYVRVPDSASLDVGDSFTLEGWIKRSSTTKAHQLFNKGANGFQLMVMGAANGNQVWLRKTSVTTIARSTSGVPADSCFHHVVATKSGPGSAQIYIDGQPVTDPTLTAPQPIANTALPLIFSRANPTTPHAIDEFAVYDQALTAQQVQDRYEAFDYRGCLET